MPAVQSLLFDACDGFSLAELRRLVRWFLDANQFDENGTLVEDPMWPDEWIEHCLNMTYFDLYQLIAQSFEGNFYDQQDFPIASGQREIPLPGTIFKVDRVMYQWGDAFWPLEYTMSPYRPDWVEGSVSWALLPSYWIKDWNTLVLNPPPATDGTLRVRWYKLPACLQGDKSRPDRNLLLVWHYLLAIKAAIKAMTKSNDDSSQLQQQANESMAIFMKALDRRSAAPKFITPWYGGSLPGVGRGGSYG